MNILKIALIPVMFLFQVGSVKSQSNNFKNFIEEYLVTFPVNSEIAIGIIDGNNKYKMGYRNENGKLVSINNESTLFEIGSISKVFTSALLMKEVERNTMSLDDPIQKHLTFRIKNDSFQNETLKVIHLITHTSGLRKNPLTSYKGYSNYLRKFDLDFIPGKTWEYNNLTIGLIGTLTAGKSHSSWDSLLRENILKPLGMKNTYASRNETPKINRVLCVNKKGEISDCYFHNVKSFQRPNGGIISNIDDMMKWLEANMDKKGLDSNMHFIHSSHDPLADTISIPWFQKYRATQGIGWWHYRTNSNNRIICHGGNMPSQTSFIAFDKVKDRGIVILTNVDGRALMNEDKIMKTTDLAIRLLEQ